MMPPVEAVKTGLSKILTTNGRARRSEYWWFILFLWLTYLACAAIDGVLGTPPVLTVASFLLLIIGSISSNVRRLHDIGRGGVWLVLNLIPIIGPIWMLVLLVKEGTTENNRYGQSPKYPAPQFPVQYTPGI